MLTPKQQKQVDKALDDLERDRLCFLKELVLDKHAWLAMPKPIDLQLEKTDWIKDNPDGERKTKG